MRKIIDPVDKEILKSQLTKEKFLRTTNHGGNEIYVVDNNNAPDVIREIGRLREEAFRAVGPAVNWILTSLIPMPHTDTSSWCCGIQKPNVS